MNSPIYNEVLHSALSHLSEKERLRLSDDLKRSVAVTCGACGGKGYFVFSHTRVDCDPCRGSGIIAPTIKLP